MKKLIIPFICILIVAFTVIKKDKIVTFATNFFENKQEIYVLSGNEYTKKTDYLYVQNSKDFIPLSYQDLLNIFYSIINNHWESFTFYCPSEYKTCGDDVKKISDSSPILSNINNFVHPYNSFTNVKTSIDANSEISVKVKYLYTKEQIAYINNEVENIINNTYNDSLSIKDNLKNIHDYIINNTRYDVDYAANRDKQTFNAYGALKEHLATCNGYSDLMAIILNKLNINNYKITYTPNSNEDGHVWNALYIDGSWLHLDLTWDDPVGNGIDYLYHKYFLVTTDEMLTADSGEVQVIEHNFDKHIYQEF